ncbi:MAG: PD-(D/E)XK nuclease family protein [Planctomycetaceae bacterium]|jgi:CRISPR/Cas system-associated exonuclease Cas4 (RecB family)|nr:PD-(D/E)XK nuclease family protein [Planctomycetaceae bacterium]
MRRIFLDWNRPLLPAVVDFFIKYFAKNGQLDLSRVVVTLPGRRAINRLEELLAEKVEKLADTKKLDSVWYPPEFLTPGTLPEKFYELQKSIANELTQRFAWIHAVDQLDEDYHDLLLRVLPHPPKRDDLNARLALGKMIATLHRELAADALDFAAVAKLCHKLKIEDEVQRWNALTKLQEKYLHLLDSLDIWDLQTARLFAINQQDSNEFQRIYNNFNENGMQIFLLGLVDMNHAQKAILNKFSDFVTSIVFAPESFKEKFDDFGCLISGTWDHEKFLLNPSIDDEQINIVERPEHQANAVLRKIASLGGKYAADEIIIGVPDPQVIPFIEQRLEQAKIPSRHVEGTPIKQTAVYRFLETVSAFLESQTFSAFAELVRHPDVETFLQQDPKPKQDLLSELDRYHTEFLPVTVSDVWQSKIDTENPQYNQSFDLLQICWNRLKELIDVDSFSPQKQSPLVWTEKTVKMLQRLYGNDNSSENDELNGKTETTTTKVDSQFYREVTEVRKKVKAAVEMLKDVPKELFPDVSFAETLRLILLQIESDNIPPHENHDAVELIGWLDIAMDDAPIAIVTGMNDGFVPSFLTSDLFLPDKIRRELGIEDNRRRFARDAYALSVILGTRSSMKHNYPVQLIGGRRSTEGDPMLPSRLFFATDNETITRRVQKYFGQIPEEPEMSFTGKIKSGQPEKSTFNVPDVEPIETPKSMRVTEFADYLQCPYRYYLKHRLRLDNLDDTDEELDAPAFGTLIHEVLRQFGQSSIKNSTSAETIASFLETALKNYVAKKYTEQPRPVIAIQTERALKRLEAFAGWQAQWAAAGHSICETELNFRNDSVFLDIDGQKISLHGRIDRIDKEEQTGRLIVLDYKTSDSAPEPEKTHRKRNTNGDIEWIDFQLPLYHYILRQSGYSEEIALGYILLPKDVTKTEVKLAQWSLADIQEAVAQAEDIARHILNNDFKITDPPPRYSEAFAAICLDNIVK